MRILYLLLITIALGSFSCEGNPHPPLPKGAEPAGDEMVLIKGGSYVVGDKRGESDEKPELRVTVRDFYIDKYEVTNAQYEKFIEAGGYDLDNAVMMRYWGPDGKDWLESLKKKFEDNAAEFEDKADKLDRMRKRSQAGLERDKARVQRYRARNLRPYYWERFEDGKWIRYEGWGLPNQPVAGVSWYEARAYARWRGKRLPTSDEWEVAARGKMRRKFPWGDELAQDDKSRLNCLRADLDRVTPVGAFPAGNTPEGLSDMAGNVMEWTEDWYHEDYYRTRKNKTPGKFPMKTLRGGSYDNLAEYCTAWWRYGKEPGYRWRNVGFRCARDANR